MSIAAGEFFSRSVTTWSRSVPYNGLGDLYQDHLHRYDNAERAYYKAIELDHKSGSGHRGLTWLCLLHKGDPLLARQFAQDATAIDSVHAGSALATLAVTTWITGWAASQALLLEWLPTCPDWLIVYARVRLVALFRKVREQGGLVTLAEILRTVADRTSWKPWSEAVSALASGDGPRGCTSAEARRIYDELS